MQQATNSENNAFTLSINVPSKTEIHRKLYEIYALLIIFFHPGSKYYPISQYLIGISTAKFPQLADEEDNFSGFNSKRIFTWAFTLGVIQVPYVVQAFKQFKTADIDMQQRVMHSCFNQNKQDFTLRRNKIDSDEVRT